METNCHIYFTLFYFGHFEGMFHYIFMVIIHPWFKGSTKGQTNLERNLKQQPFKCLLKMSADETPPEDLTLLLKMYFSADY